MGSERNGAVLTWGGSDPGGADDDGDLDALDGGEVMPHEVRVERLVDKVELTQRFVGPFIDHR